MLQKYSITLYAIIAGLAAVIFFPYRQLQTMARDRLAVI